MTNETLRAPDQPTIVTDGAVLGRAPASLLDEVPGLVSLAVPVVAGLAGSTVISVVDSLMLGPLGEIPLAAASLTQSVLVVFYAGLYGLVGAVGLLAGQAYGAGESRRVSDVLRHGLLIGLIGGEIGALAMAALLPVLALAGQPPEVMAVIADYWIAMSALLVPFALSMVVKLYLDSIGRPWTAAILTLVPIALNIPLNWLLIYGHLGFPKWGLLGAGVASLISVSAGFIIMLAYLRWAPSLAAYREASDGRRTALSELTREGYPMAVQYVAEGSAVAVAGVLIGLLGATALAANQIVFSVAVLVYMVPLGMSGAVSIRIAQATGGCAGYRVRSIGLAGMSVVTVWMIFFSILMIGWGDAIARLFVVDTTVIAAATAMFMAVGFMQIADGLQSVGLGALRGILDNRWPTRVALISYWLIALPLSAVFGFYLGFGAPGIWAGFGIGLAIGGALFVWRFVKMTQRFPRYGAGASVVKASEPMVGGIGIEPMTPRV